jgi:hypothetical protein
MTTFTVTIFQPRTNKSPPYLKTTRNAKRSSSRPFRAGKLLHVTFGSVLTMGKSAAGRPFRDALLENLANEASLYKEVLEHHLGKHLELLDSG